MDQAFAFHNSLVYLIQYSIYHPHIQLKHWVLINIREHQVFRIITKNQFQGCVSSWTMISSVQCGIEIPHAMYI